MSPIFLSILVGSKVLSLSDFFSIVSLLSLGNTSPVTLSTLSLFLSSIYWGSSTKYIMFKNSFLTSLIKSS